MSFLGCVFHFVIVVRLCVIFACITIATRLNMNVHYNIVYVTKWSYFRNKFSVLFFFLLFLSARNRRVYVYDDYEFRYHISLFVRLLPLHWNWVQFRWKCHCQRRNTPLHTWIGFDSRVVQTKYSSWFCRRIFGASFRGVMNGFLPFKNEVLNFPVISLFLFCFVLQLKLSDLQTLSIARLIMTIQVLWKFPFLEPDKNLQFNDFNWRSLKNDDDKNTFPKSVQNHGNINK